MEWAHSVQDAAAMVRDFVKWDDLPCSLPHFAESTVRAYKIAMTPPMMPVLIVLDGGLQEDPISDEVSRGCASRSSTLTSPPQGDAGAGRGSRATARRRAESGHHRRSSGRGRRPGMTHLIELAETAAGAGDRPGRPHELPIAAPAQPVERRRAAARQRRRDPRPRADRLLGHGRRVPRFADSLVASADQARHEVDQHHRRATCYTKGNYQDFQRYPEVDIAMAADAEATLPALIEAVKRAMTSDRKTGVRARAGSMAEAACQRAAIVRAPTRRWRGTRAPISTARLSAELCAT